MNYRLNGLSLSYILVLALRLLREWLQSEPHGQYPTAAVPHVPGDPASMVAVQGVQGCTQGGRLGPYTG